MQRWGLELQQLLPYLKIGYRKGVENGLADLLSRFPYFRRYIRRKEDVVSLPDDLYEQVAEVQLRQGLQDCRKVHAYTHVNSEGKVGLRLSTTGMRLYERRDAQEVEEIWQEGHPCCTLQLNLARNVVLLSLF